MEGLFARSTVFFYILKNPLSCTMLKENAAALGNMFLFKDRPKAQEAEP